MPAWMPALVRPVTRLVMRLVMRLDEPQARRAALCVCAVAAAVAVSLMPRRAEAAPAAGVRRAPPVSVAGAPRSLLTLVVPVPVELQDAASLRFQVALSGMVEVLGRLDGAVDVSPTGERRPVMLTLRVPATALVGLLDVADVVFSTDAGVSVAVPIILRVPQVRDVRVGGLRELSDLDRGDRVEVAYRVQNLGNARERLQVRLSPPQQWRAELRGPADVSVDAYGDQEIAVSLRVPPMPNSGSYTFGVTLVRDAGTRDSVVVASATTTLRVREPVQRAPGLGFYPFVGAATSGDGTGFATGLRINGPIRSDLILDAAVTPQPDVPGLGRLGLANVGVGTLPLNASLRAPNWHVRVGNTQGGFDNLTGQGYGGQGVASGFTRGALRVEALAARPGGGSNRRGDYAAGRVNWEGDLGRFGSTISILDESNPAVASAGRSLRALGLDWASAGLTEFGEFRAGLALRNHARGTSLGAEAGFERRTERDQLRVQVLTAPGGSASFAPMSNRASIAGERAVTDRLRVSGNASWQGDVNAALRDLTMRSVAVGARYALSEVASVSARLSDDALDVSGAAIGDLGFGSRQQALALGSALAVREWTFTLDGRLARLERSTALFSGAESRRVALQRSVGGGVSRPFLELGSVSAAASLVQSGAGLGFPENQWLAQVRWAQVPLVIAGEVLRLEQELRWAGTSLTPARAAWKSGVSTTLRSGFDIAMSLERNPFLRDAQGRAGLIAAARVTLSGELLTSDRLLTPGTVFRDENGNGRLDEDERGLSGVVLIFDRQRFRTNRRGEYRVPASYRGRLQVDPTTIPAGYVLHPRFRADTVERRDVPLVPTTTLQVSLRLEPDADGRVPDARLDLAEVWLRDVEGFEWVGRHVGAGRFVFEHVPVGAYVVLSDLSRSPDPLRMDDLSVTLKSGQPAAVEATLRGRSVRIISPPRGGRGGGRGSYTPRNSPNRTGGQTGRQGAPQ